MFKKLVLGTLLVGLVSVLVVGAIIRTKDKTEQVAGAGPGRGRRWSVAAEGRLPVAEAGQDIAANGQSTGSGGYGRRNTSEERQYPNYDQMPQDWVVVEGTVVQAPTDGVDLVIETQEGTEIVVGTGPGYMESKGFTLQAGEKIQISGYWQDDELKAAEVTRLRDGESIALRDAAGHPAWAGSGWRAQADARRRAGGQGRAQGGGNESGDSVYAIDRGASLTVEGTVLSLDDSSLIVQTTNGDEIVVENRPWWFAREQGFSVQVGDQVTLVGFYEGETFETSRITDVTSGQTVEMREEGGRPLWAGGRGRG